MREAYWSISRHLVPDPGARIRFGELVRVIGHLEVVTVPEPRLFEAGLRFSAVPPPDPAEADRQSPERPGTPRSGRAPSVRRARPDRPDEIRITPRLFRLWRKVPR